MAGRRGKGGQRRARICAQDGAGARTAQQFEPPRLAGLAVPGADELRVIPRGELARLYGVGCVIGQGRNGRWAAEPGERELVGRRSFRADLPAGVPAQRPASRCGDQEQPRVRRSQVRSQPFHRIVSCFQEHPREHPLLGGAICDANADQLPYRAVVESAFQEHGGGEDFEEERSASRQGDWQEGESDASEDGEGLKGVKCRVDGKRCRMSG